MDLNFTPVGPVSAAFINDRSFFSGIMGPMGSAKTSSCINKMVRITSEQAVSPRLGERLVKFGVVRDTLTNMKRTTFKSIEEWFPRGGDWGGGGSAIDPPYFKAGFRLPDGTIARLWLDFVGLDMHNIEQLAKGWNLTGYWLNEGDLLPPEIKTYLDGRAGRYPSKMDGGPTWRGGICDYNAPDTENYLYKLLEEKTKEDPDVARTHKLYKQPDGFSPKAENVHNLPEGYYRDMAIGKEEWWIRRNIRNQYGFSREGQPVYETYNDDFHCGGVILEPVKGISIVCYADAALRPAMIFTQTLPGGQRRILGEIYISGGAKQLGEAAMTYGAKNFPGFKLKGGMIDPSADKRDENDSEAENYIATLNRAMGLSGAERFRPAPTNDPVKRQDAVKYSLNRTSGAGQPALLVSAKATVARKGFNSTYRFKKRANGEIEDKPEKSHPVSDVHDAIQYYGLDEGGYEEITATESNKKSAQSRGFGGGQKNAKVGVKS